jgi:hypothetical protein
MYPLLRKKRSLWFHNPKTLTSLLLNLMKILAVRGLAVASAKAKNLHLAAHEVPVLVHLLKKSQAAVMKRIVMRRILQLSKIASSQRKISRMILREMNP